MNKLMIGLSFAALAQVGLASALWWQQHQAQAVATTLLTLDTEQLTQLQLEHQGKTLQLVRKEGQWLLPDLQNEPARTAKVQALLSELDKARLDWPVADTSVSQDRFEVAEDKFQWKLTLTAGEQQQQIYLGQSPAFKQLYLRRDNEAEIYQQSISTLDWSTEPAQWFDKNLLQLNQISSIKVQDLQLQKEQDSWTFSSPDLQEQGAAKPADTATVDKLRQLFSSLQVTGPAQQALLLNQPDAEQQDLAVEVQSLTGKYSYQLKKQQEQFLLKRHDKAGWYPVAGADVQMLFELTPEQLLVKETGNKNEERAADHSSETAAPN